jgi:hypothetical protein
MLRDRALSKRTDQELLEVGDGELDGRGGEEPLAETGQMYRVRHNVKRGLNRIGSFRWDAGGLKKEKKEGESGMDAAGNVVRVE